MKKLIMVLALAVVTSLTIAASEKTGTISTVDQNGKTGTINVGGTEKNFVSPTIKVVPGQVVRYEVGGGSNGNGNGNGSDLSKGVLVIVGVPAD